MTEMSFLPTLPSLMLNPQVPIIHRDLSWLQFNERVLAEARDPSNPLMERLKFLAITASNLDEFFMIRFSSLQRALSRSRLDPLGGNQLDALRRVRSSIFESVSEFGVRQAEVLDVLSEELRRVNVHVVRLQHSDAKTWRAARKLFETEILPHLTAPERFSWSQLSGLQNLQIAAIFGQKTWFKIPKSLPMVFWRRAGETKIEIFFLDDMIVRFLGEKHGLLDEPMMIRVTRDGDSSLEIGHDPESLPDVVRSQVRIRDKGSPFRLQYLGEISEEFLTRALGALKIKKEQSFQAPHTLVLNGLLGVVGKVRPFVKKSRKLNYRDLRSSLPPVFRTTSSLFEGLKEQDFLLHHPYDSFEGVVNLIEEAARDPKVKMIEQTVYRMDAVSPVIDILKSAAKHKKVRAVIELRARFDELNNLRLAEELTNAGVEVAFGFGKLKLHAKIALITRMERGKEVRYTHLSTGNYNSVTARMYTDLAIVTAHPQIGSDARVFFDSIVKGTVPTQFAQLVPAPAKLHRRLQLHIRNEMKAALRGEPARIVAKVNALVDEQIIESLYLASQAGVRVDLIVRGACSLVPGIRGLSENIQVLSVVDRFLEHSRIYYFENSKAMYLSSADWMPRNFFSRLELAFPVLDSRIYSYLKDVVIPVYLNDSVKARELTPQGIWRSHVDPQAKLPLRSQFFFEELAMNDYKGTSLEF